MRSMSARWESGWAIYTAIEPFEIAWDEERALVNLLGSLIDDGVPVEEAQAVARRLCIVRNTPGNLDHRVRLVDDMVEQLDRAAS